MFRGKRYKENAKLVERGKLYDPKEALALVVSTANSKFDETIELHVLSVSTRDTLTSKFAALSFF